MAAPRHVLLELDEQGDLHSVDGDSDAPAVVGATEGDSPPAPARPAIAGAVPVADLTPEERRMAATPVSMLTPTLPASSALSPPPPPRHILLQNCDDEDGGAAFCIQSSATSFSARGNGDLRAPPAAPAAAPPRRSGRAPAPKVIVDPEAPTLNATITRRSRGPPRQRTPAQLAGESRTTPKPLEMRRVGDAEWRWFGSRADAAKAFGVSGSDVCKLIKDPSKATDHARETFEARPAPPRKRERPTKWKAPRKKQKHVEGANQKANGKWTSPHFFPGREFDDLDEYRAAKKQRAEFRAAYSADNIPLIRPKNT